MSDRIRFPDVEEWADLCFTAARDVQPFNGIGLLFIIQPVSMQGLEACTELTGAWVSHLMNVKTSNVAVRIKSPE